MDREELDVFDILDIYPVEKGGKLSRRECIKIFRRKKINVSISLFITSMDKLGSCSVYELCDRSEKVIDLLRREWLINEIV